MTIPTRFRPLLWLVILVVAALGLRAPFLGRLQWNLDEGVTFTVAQQIREGGVLYRDAVDHRSPLVPYLKAAIFAVTGDWNVHAVHVIVALALGVVAFLLYDLARRLGRAAVGGWAAGAFTVCAIMLPGSYDSFAAHTEWFVVFFSALGFWLFARSAATGGFLAGLPVGLAFGASALCKQPGLLDFGVVWVLLAFLALAEPASRGRALRLWLGAVTGTAACFAAAFAYFAAHGALRDFLYYGWTYNTTIYVPEVPTADRLKTLRLPFALAWQYLPPALILALAGAVSLLRSVARFRFSLLPWLILGWTAAGLVSCALSGREFDHYVIQSVPGFSLAVGWMLWRLTAALAPGEPRRWRRALAAILVLALAGWTATAVVAFCRKLKPHDDPSNATVTTLLQRYSAPRDPIFVWGYYPEAHLLSRRLPATRFVYSNFLTGMIPWTNLEVNRDTRYAIVPGAWDAFWRDYRAHPPILIVEAVMRGYLKYPLLGRAGLRDEIIDHYAEMEHVLAERSNLNLYRRLAPPPTEFPGLEAAPDSAVQLHPARVNGSPDIAFVRIVAPGGGGTVTLRLGGRPYRHVVLPENAPVDVAFLVRLADLSTPGAPMIDAVVSRPGRVVASPALDLVRRLSLEVHPAEPVPVLAYSIGRIASLPAPDPAVWHAEPRGESLGWRTSGPFTLAFARPAALETVELRWLPPAGTAAMPTFAFHPADAPAITLNADASPTAQGARQFVLSLPPGVTGTLTLRWAPSSAQNETEVWLGDLIGYASGPSLRFRDRDIRPALAEHVAGSPFTHQSDERWTVAPPARLLYPRLDRMNALVVSYGFADRAYTDPTAHPGEIGLEVNFVHEDGHRENLHSDLIRPRLNPETRGTHTRRVGLPPNVRGEIEIKTGVVPGSESPDNVLYLYPPRIQGPGPDIVIAADRILTPAESETVSGDPISVCVDGRWVAHAPGHVVYHCPADLRTVEFGFGLDERCYWGDHGEMRTNGIDVSVEFRDEQENSTELYRRRIDPRLVVPDRGVQHGRVTLPGRPGKLVFHMSPGPNNDAAYDWSFWTDFTGTVK